MGLDPLTEGLHLGGSLVDLVGGILERGDRDKLGNELNENTTKVQNSFADYNTDAQWALSCKLFDDAGHPIAPPRALGGTAEDQRRIADRLFRFNALLIAAELIYLRGVVGRLVSQRVK